LLCSSDQSCREGRYFIDFIEGARQLLKQFNGSEDEYPFVDKADILLIGSKDMLNAEDEELKPLFLDYKLKQIKSATNEW
jgi:hypothetical protein